MQDLKAVISGLPGAIEAHRLLKNARFRLRSTAATRGGVERGGMSVAEAASYTGNIFDKIDARVTSRGGWAGKRVLEIGPGDSLGTGLRCLAAGAGSYCAIDRFAVAIDPDFEDAVFTEIQRDLDQGERIRIQRYLPGGDGFDDTFRYMNDLPVERAPADLGEAAFDVVFSNAVLEHVADIPGTLSACRSLLDPGGFMYHEVDLRSHQTYEPHPLHFLEYPEWFWRLMSSHNGEPNRARLPEYTECLARLGFRITELKLKERFTAEEILRVRPRLARRFVGLDDEDLSPAVFEIVCELSPPVPS